MECPHLEVGAEVEAAARAGAGGGKCGGCEATQGLWLCLTCGALNCGRYVAGHAKTHHDSTGHSTALDWTELSVFCYQCDEYAVNEDARLAAVRAAKSAPTPRRSLRPRKPTKRSPTGRQEEVRTPSHCPMVSSGACREGEGALVRSSLKRKPAQAFYGSFFYCFCSLFFFY
jgi:hypothetical protein